MMNDDPEGATADGRVQRSVRTRAKLIEAYLDVIRSERRIPATQELARRADCSVRTVFERFGTLEGVGVAAFDHVLEHDCRPPRPEAVAPVRDRERRVRLLVALRARVAERWHPAWQLATQHASEELEARMDRVRNANRDQVRWFFAAELATIAPRAAEDLLIALEAVLDISVWSRMRHRHGLTREQARSAWREAVDRILPQSASLTVGRAPFAEAGELPAAHGFGAPLS